MNIIKKKLGITIGGKVIGSGGYGCIFDPPLKCINNNDNDPNNGIKLISKLMTKSHAESEYNEIIEFKPYLEDIPNYKDYFLIDNVSLCRPKEISQTDLENYGTKCKTLKKEDITVNNINKKLDNLLAVNMENGGLDLGDYFERNYSYSDMIEINTNLSNLMMKAIIPMNRNGIYHCDIKESNIMVQREEDGKKFYTRLIDWGLAVHIKGDISKTIPKNLKSRPFQYNVPFSVIILSEDFSKMYDDFLSKCPTPEYYEIRTFVIDYIFYWNNKRGQGHLKVINSIFGKMFSSDIKFVDTNDKQLVIEMEYTYNYIIEYISQILMKYTHNGRFDLMTYFNNIFLKIVDIWGLLVSYEPIFTYFCNKYNDLEKIEMEIFISLRELFMKYLYEPRLEPIKINELTNRLKSLNKLFEIAGKQVQSKTSLTKNKKITVSTVSLKSNSSTKKSKKSLKKTSKSVTKKNTKIDKIYLPNSSISAQNKSTNIIEEAMGKYTKSSPKFITSSNLVRID